MRLSYTPQSFLSSGFADHHSVPLVPLGPQPMWPATLLSILHSFWLPPVSIVLYLSKFIMVLSMWKVFCTKSGDMPLLFMRCILTE